MAFSMVKKLPSTAKAGQTFGLKTKRGVMHFERTHKPKGFGMWKIISKKK